MQVALAAAVVRAAPGTVPLMVFTRRVRTALNVEVLPLALWITPLTRPRARRLPFFCERDSGVKYPVTRWPLLVCPTILDLALPRGPWAIRVNDPDVAPAPALPVAEAVEPPVNIRVMTVMAMAVTRAIPAVVLPLDPKRDMVIPSQADRQSRPCRPHAGTRTNVGSDLCPEPSLGVVLEVSGEGRRHWWHEPPAGRRRSARRVSRALRGNRLPAGLSRRQLARPAADGHRRPAADVRRERVGRPPDPRLGRALVRPAADPRRRPRPCLPGGRAGTGRGR